MNRVYSTSPRSPRGFWKAWLINLSDSPKNNALVGREHVQTIRNTAVKLGLKVTATTANRTCYRITVSK